MRPMALLIVNKLSPPFEQFTIEYSSTNCDCNSLGIELIGPWSNSMWCFHFKSDGGGAGVKSSSRACSKIAISTPYFCFTSLYVIYTLHSAWFTALDYFNPNVISVSPLTIVKFQRNLFHFVSSYNHVIQYSRLPNSSAAVLFFSWKKIPPTFNFHLNKKKQDWKGFQSPRLRRIAVGYNNFKKYHGDENLTRIWQVSDRNLMGILRESDRNLTGI